MLIRLYIDGQLKLLSASDIGCYTGDIFVGALCIMLMMLSLC